jgi:glutathione S-transferase
LRDFPFVIGKKPTIADISSFDFAVSHPSIAAWLDGVSALPGWRPPYDLLPGKRLQCYRAR